MQSMIKYILLAGVVTAAVIGAGIYFLGGGDGLPLSADPGNQVQVAMGKTLYAENCASCHGANLEGQKNWRTPLSGGGLPAPPHDASGHTWHHPDALLFRYTKLGGAQLAPPSFKSNMPGFEDSLSDGEIWAVLSYIKNQWPPKILRRQTRMSQTQ
jgi:mono/diheme cytochrome c family protein